MDKANFAILIAADCFVVEHTDLCVDASVSDAANRFPAKVFHPSSKMAAPDPSEAVFFLNSVHIRVE